MIGAPPLSAASTRVHDTFRTGEPSRSATCTPTPAGAATGGLKPSMVRGASSSPSPVCAAAPAVNTTLKSAVGSVVGLPVNVTVTTVSLVRAAVSILTPAGRSAERLSVMATPSATHSELASVSVTTASSRLFSVSGDGSVAVTARLGASLGVAIVVPEYAPVPSALLARTCTSYWVPMVSPVRMRLVSVPVGL